MITVAAAVLAVVGGLLVGDVMRVWRMDRDAVAGPERAQLLTGIAILVFAGAFLVARGAGETTQVAPAAPSASTAVRIEDSKLTRLAAPARLPALRAEVKRQRPQPKPANEKPAAEPAEPAPTTTTTTTTTPTTTPVAPTTTTPAAPPPAPPADNDVPFDSRE